MFGLLKTVLAALSDEPAHNIGESANVARPAGGARVSPQKQPEFAPAPMADPNAADALRRIFSHRDPAQAGSIHLVGLESLRARLGRQWGTVSERVHLLAAKLLESHLSPHDTWFRHEGETYVVVFAQLGPEQARLICAKVVEELQLMLLGEADTATIMVRTAMHEIGSDVMLVPASLKQMLNNAAMQLAHEATAYLDRPTGIRSRQVENAGRIEVRYRPVWDVKQQVLSVFIARPGRMREGRSPLWGYDGLQDTDDPHQILAMDLHLIQEAVGEAAELYENRFRFFLSIPIHFESLAVQGRRREVVAVLQDIPTHMRGFMTYHLIGVPAGVPTGRLAEMVSTLRPYSRTIMVVVDPASNDLPTLAAAGVKVACVLLPPGCSADRYRADLLRFGAIAAKNRLLTSVEGVDNMAMEALCEEAGISFLSGDLIGGWTEVPEHAVRRSLADFQR